MGISGEFKKVREGIGSGLRDIIELESILRATKHLLLKTAETVNFKSVLRSKNGLRKTALLTSKGMMPPIPVFLPEYAPILLQQ